MQPYPLACPHCRNALAYDHRFSNQVVACPHCNGAFQMPTFQQPQSQTPHPPPTPSIQNKPVNPFGFEASESEEEEDEPADRARPVRGQGRIRREKSVSPKMTRQTLIGAVACGALLLSCVVCGVVGSIFGSAGSSDDVLKQDGKAPNQAEVKAHVDKHGPKPQFSSYDGSFEEVKKYLADSLNDPRSVEYVEWSKVVMNEDGWNIRAKYRAKNGFGALITKEQIFTVRHGKVAYARDR